MGFLLYIKKIAEEVLPLVGIAIVLILLLMQYLFVIFVVHTIHLC